MVKVIESLDSEGGKLKLMIELFFCNIVRLYCLIDRK